MDYVWNGISLVGVVSAIFTLLVICVPKLRSKFAEYIILKHGEEEQVKWIQDLKQEVADLKLRVEENNKSILELSEKLAACKASLSYCEKLVRQCNQLIKSFNYPDVQPSTANDVNE